MSRSCLHSSRTRRVRTLKVLSDRYYEFLCFEVWKVVRSPGYDHGHDEESQNGRDVKIDILDDYVRTPEWFRGVSNIYRSTGGLLEPPGGLNGPTWALVEIEGSKGSVGCAPKAQTKYV